MVKHTLPVSLCVCVTVSACKGNNFPSFVCAHTVSVDVSSFRCFSFRFHLFHCISFRHFCYNSVIIVIVILRNTKICGTFFGFDSLMGEDTFAHLRNHRPMGEFYATQVVIFGGNLCEQRCAHQITNNCCKVRLD